MITELYKVVVEVPEFVYRNHFFSKGYGKVVQGAKVNAIDFGFEVYDNDETEQYFEWAVFDDELQAMDCEQIIIEFFDSLLLESTIEEYDNRGNLIHYKDATEEWWKVFDDQDRLTSWSDHTGRGKIFEYDAQGNRIYLREFDNDCWSEHVYEYEYYLSSERYCDSSGDVSEVRYDPNGEVI